MTSGCAKRASLALVLCVSLSTWASCSFASGPDSKADDWSPEAVAADLKAVPRVERITLDTWIGKQSTRGGLDLGVGLVFPWGKWRPSLQIAQDRAGFGLGYRLVPVLDVSVGIQGIWDLRTGDLQPGVFVSLFRF